MENGASSNSSAEVEQANLASSNAEKDSATIEIPEFKNWSVCSIFRVPGKLRDLKLTAYTPHLVSIGPFHHGREELKGMESHKQKYYFEEFCRRSSKSTDNLLSFIRERSDRISASYAGAVQFRREAFEKMILIDACFIFELFSRFSEATSRGKDYILTTPWLFNEISMDLIMLENQIPFPFLEELYNFSHARLDNYPLRASNSRGHAEDPYQDQKQPSTVFVNLAINFFGVPPGTLDMNHKIRHFTDLIRQSRLPVIMSKSEGDKKYISKQNHLYSAKKLEKAGVYFAPASTKKGSIMSSSGKVQVSERRPLCKSVPFLRSLQLELPLFSIDDNTECVMRNIMALEQCLYPNEEYICSYVYLMCELIDTEEDLDFLAEKKIIENSLGSDQEATDLINELCQNIVMVRFIYGGECKQLNNFYEKWYNKAKTTLKRVYFRDLWTASSTIVGIFVLIFTTVATLKSLFLF
ncbi:hypothetical protein TorRG33x02_354940 [Trema orientale]|uniref:Uncharacterized protein n=1 Tax=Trema orientale TaxID=63057 RepID=A0A2P5AAA1_TREOI|nr:hypothetical protein TorRG33x02_354940 [Trema orientale]